MEQGSSISTKILIILSFFPVLFCTKSLSTFLCSLFCVLIWIRLEMFTLDVTSSDFDEGTYFMSYIYFIVYNVLLILIYISISYFGTEKYLTLHADAIFSEIALLNSILHILYNYFVIMFFLSLILFCIFIFLNYILLPIWKQFYIN
jgi:hypothetical protein